LAVIRPVALVLLNSVIAVPLPPAAEVPVWLEPPLPPVAVVVTDRDETLFTPGKLSVEVAVPAAPGLPATLDPPLPPKML
jgi:hypothetical protein